MPSDLHFLYFGHELHVWERKLWKLSLTDLGLLHGKYHWVPSFLRCTWMVSGSSSSWAQNCRGSLTGCWCTEDRAQVRWVGSSCVYVDPNPAVEGPLVLAFTQRVDWTPSAGHRLMSNPWLLLECPGRVPACLLHGYPQGRGHWINRGLPRVFVAFQNTTGPTGMAVCLGNQALTLTNLAPFQVLGLPSVAFWRSHFKAPCVGSEVTLLSGLQCAQCIVHGGQNGVALF